ncbi:MAG: GerMN domain-containing protein [Acidimicrobiales bacterium]
MKPLPAVRPRCRAVACLVAVVLVVSSCGIPQDDGPRAIGPVLATPTPEATPEPECVQSFTIFLLDADKRLVPVRRDVPADLRIPDLIAALVADPSEAERAQGLGTAVPALTTLNPNPEVNRDTEIATIDIAGGSLDLGPGLLTEALAQLVYTLTESGSISAVRILVDGERVPWPTDEGESDRPLSPDDYRSFAPRANLLTEPTPTPLPGCEDAPRP